MREAVVFFAANERSRRGPERDLRRRLRVIHRRPRKACRRGLVRGAQLLSQSRLSHCAVGFKGAVLDPTLRGHRFWPFIPFVEGYPGLVCAAIVPLARAVDLDDWPDRGPKPALPTVAKWLTRGRVHTTDCACVVRDVLRAGGVDVPPVPFPIHLHRWLLQRGYEHVAIRRVPAAEQLCPHRAA